jgi:hypothetical protein
MNSPEFLQVMLAKQKEINPMATVVAGGDAATQMKSVEEEIRQLEAMMGTNEWYSTENDGKRARLRELYDVQLAMHSKGS